MSHAIFEVILLHFLKRLIRIPAIVSHSVKSAHRSGAMAAAGAMNEHRLVCGVVHYLQEEFRLLDGWPVLVAHSDSVELHSMRLDHRLFSIIAGHLQIDDCLHSHCREVCIIFFSWLGAAIERVIKATEILDVNLA